MASSSERDPSRRQSMANLTLTSSLSADASPGDHEHDLSQSLNKLSLSTAPVAHRNAPRSPSALSPYRPSASRNPSSTTAATPRAPSRSPSVGTEARSRSSTPTLLRKASTSSLRSANGKTPGQTPSRRSSLAQASSPTPRTSLTAAVPEEPQKPAPTANSVARDYFRAELDARHSPTSSHPTKALVILHDACYGHRFSRPKTSRAALSTIVERPERIKASALGVAMAYVRLGERHCDGAYPVHPRLDPSSIPTLPFRIHKTARRVPLTSPAVTNVHGTKWMDELKVMCTTAESKLAMGAKELQRPGNSRGPEQPGAPAKLHEGDLYLCSESLDAFEGALGAVCEAVDRVFTAGPLRAFVAVRPPGHHCSASYPSGFCWINNVHVGIMHAILSHGLTHAAIIDIDLHHGDGSQGITWQHNARGSTAPKNAAAWKKASIGYFSLHDINSYPCEMGDEEKVKNASLCIENAHGQNIWNVHLHSWDSETAFWKLYETRYATLLEKTRAYLQQQAARLRAAGQVAKAAIFLSAGFDASEWETKGMQRHNVNVPTEFYARITQDIVKVASEEGLGVDGRVVSVLEGGYSDRALFSGVFSHISGLVGDQSSSAPLPGRPGLGHEMSQRMGVAGESKPVAEEAPPPVSLHNFDPSWWSSVELDRLEAAMGTPPAEPKKPRHGTPPTYSSPTQASTAKIAYPVKARRSASGFSSASESAPRPPTPPPPDVPWTVAVHELGKLLIPSDRQTDSYRAGDLNAEATRVRRDRQWAMNPPDVPGKHDSSDRPSSRMSLRGRKPAKSIVESHVDEGEDVVLTGRRKTDFGAALGGDKSAARGVLLGSSASGATKRSGRRLSGTASASATPARKTLTRNASGTSVPQADVHDSRSESSTIEGAPLNTSLSVKKTRAPAASRGGPARAARGGKKAAAAPTGTSQPTVPAASTLEHPQDGESTPNTVNDDEIEGITSSMKKIKINLITKSQKEQRNREAMATSAETLTAPDEEARPMMSPTDSQRPPTDISEPPKLPFATGDGRSSPLTMSTAAPLHASSTLAGRSGPVTSPLKTPAETGPSIDPLMGAMPSTQATPAASSTANPQALPVSLQGPDMFVPYQPEGPEPMSVPQQEMLTWLPPNTATPAPVRRTDLPVFTSTSTIPFAPSKTSSHPASSRPASKAESLPGKPVAQEDESTETHRRGDAHAQ